MSPRRALATALLALALAPVTAGAQDAARDGLRRLQSHEQRTRLQDLSIDSRRRLEADRLRATGGAIDRDRTERRWRAEDRRIDFVREREREAIESSVDAAERLERSAERLPDPAPTPAAERIESRAAFDREAAEIEQRERLERLRRQARPDDGTRRADLAALSRAPAATPGTAPRSPGRPARSRTRSYGKPLRGTGRRARRMPSLLLDPEANVTQVVADLTQLSASGG